MAKLTYISHFLSRVERSFQPTGSIPCHKKDRSRIRTEGDMATIIIEDERVMRLKNADLAAMREYREALERGQ